MEVIGKCIKYGDNIDTDVIIPARYLNTSDHQELAKHCMEDIDTDFAEKAKEAKVADGAMYKQAGNAVSVNTIYAVLYYLITNNIMQR